AKILQNFLLHPQPLAILSYIKISDCSFQYKMDHLQRNSLKRLDNKVLRHLNNLEHVKQLSHRLKENKTNCTPECNILSCSYFDEFKLCSAALHVRRRFKGQIKIKKGRCNGKIDSPAVKGLSTQKTSRGMCFGLRPYCDLKHFKDSYVYAAVWVMAVLACAGNTIVLLGRLVAREPNPVHSLYIKTLALADLLMGVYLLLIAAADWRYRGIYVQHEFQWRHSYICSTCGFLSTLSCEASVLILTLITRDRLVSVTRPLDRRQPSLTRATLLVAALWLVAAVIALLPLSSQAVDYFGEEFYGGNGVCLPLHVQDPFAQ
ncbi:hypothetical protein L9F63_011883, partial [Diploptera punctata]